MDRASERALFERLQEQGIVDSERLIELMGERASSSGDRDLAGWLVERGVADRATIERLVASVTGGAPPAPPRPPVAQRPPPPPSAAAGSSGGAPRGTGRNVPAAAPAKAAANAPAPAPPAGAATRGGSNPAPGAAPERIGPYPVERLLGEGVTGHSYLAKDPENGRRVVVKVLHAKLAGDRVAAAQFERETRAASGITEAGARPVVASGAADDGRPYCVSPYVDGPNLADYVRERAPLLPRRAAEIVREAARALEPLHARGVVHGALKPQNLLLDAQRRVHLADFGQAPDLLDERGSAARSPAPLAVQNEALCFYPPERLRPMRPRATRESDIYGLGALLYVGLTARSPIDAPTAAAIVARRGQVTPVRELEPSVHPDLAEICLHALAANPAERYRDAGALATDLEAFLEGHVTAVGVASGQAAVRIARNLRRSPRALIGAFAAIFLVVIGTLGAFKILFRQADALKERELAEARELRKKLEEERNAVNWKTEQARREAEGFRSQLEELSARTAGDAAVLERLLAVGWRPELARDEAFWKTVSEADPSNAEAALQHGTLVMGRIDATYGTVAAVTGGDSPATRPTPRPPGTFAAQPPQGEPPKDGPGAELAARARLDAIDGRLAKRVEALTREGGGGQPKSAEEGLAIERARRLQAWSQYLRGRAHFHQRENADAENAFREAEKLDPAGQIGIRAQAWRLRTPLFAAASKEAGLRQILGLYQGLVQRVERAAPTFDRPIADAWEVRLEAAVLMFQIVTGLQAQGRANTPEFQQLYRDLFDGVQGMISVRPGEWVGYILRGFLLLMANRLNESLVDANRALMLFPESVVALRLKVSSLGGLKRAAEVVQLLTTEKPRHEGDARMDQLYNEVGNSFIQSHEAALKRGALTDAWNDLKCVQALDSRIAQQQLPKLVGAVDAAIAASDTDHAVRGVRGMIRFEQGDVDGARADLDRVVELQPEEHVFRLIRARVRSRQRDYDGASADIEYVKERNAGAVQQFSNNGPYESEFTKLLNAALGRVTGGGAMGGGG